jgi:hypothetical protein
MNVNVGYINLFNHNVRLDIAVWVVIRLFNLIVVTLVLILPMVCVLTYVSGRTYGKILYHSSHCEDTVTHWWYSLVLF